MPACGVELPGESKGLGLSRAGVGTVGSKFASWKMQVSGCVSSCSHVIPVLGQGMLVADMGSRVPRRMGTPECQPRRSCPTAKQTDQIPCVLEFPISASQQLAPNNVYSFEIRAALLLNPEDVTNKILFSQFLVLKASSFFLPPTSSARFLSVG